MTDKQRKYKNRSEYINTQKVIVTIAQQKLAKGETLTEEENNSYQQALTILQEKGLLADQQKVTTVINKTSYDIELVSIAHTKPEPIRWLWPNYLAKGKVHILSGMAGTGKTTLAIGLAATVSTGGYFPDGEPCKTKGNIIIWSAEDDINDTLSPRILAAGADQYKVFCINCKVNPITFEKVPFDISQDIPLLNKQVKDIGGIDLFIIDPIVSAVRGDMHRANDVRYALQPLVDFAQHNNCAVLGITHFSKNTSGKNPLERVTGSQAFGALARIVLVAAKEKDGQTRVLAIAKSNIGQDNGGVHYHLEQVTLNNGINASKVVWGEVLEGNATDILNDLEQPEGDQRENNEPSEVLKELLIHGKMLLGDVKQLMKNNGFTDKQLRTARKKLGVKSIREGFSKEMKTYLALPQLCPNSPVMPTILMGKTDKKRQNWTDNTTKNTTNTYQEKNNNLINNDDDEGVYFDL